MILELLKCIDEVIVIANLEPFSAKELNGLTVVFAYETKKPIHSLFGKGVQDTMEKLFSDPLALKAGTDDELVDVAEVASIMACKDAPNELLILLRNPVISSIST